MPVLTRQATSLRPAPTLSPAPGLTLLQGRCHEGCGPARRSFALMLARASKGPILWIHPAHGEGTLSGDGLADWVAPGRLLLAAPRRPGDMLWAAEEALRSGALPLVILELPEPPPLTPIRRLHLAAQSAAKGLLAPGTRPTCLLLTPGQGGAQGIESRWHMAPAPGRARDKAHPAWHLTRTRARLAPEAAWRLTRNGEELHAAQARQA